MIARGSNGIYLTNFRNTAFLPLSFMAFTLHDYGLRSQRFNHDDPCSLFQRVFPERSEEPFRIWSWIRDEIEKRGDKRKAQLLYSRFEMTQPRTEE